MDIPTQQRNGLIAFGVLAGTGAILAIIRTWKWFARSGRMIVDLITIAKFLMFLMGIIGTILVFLTAGISLACIIQFRDGDGQEINQQMGPLRDLLRTFLIVGFVLKTIDMIHLLIRQSGVEIFFIDWEKSKTARMENVSIWRTYFAANEWNEIQTFRRINVSFQILATLFFLKVINLENIACIQYTSDTPLSNICSVGYNSVYRVVMGSAMFLGIAILQYIAYVSFYQHFFEDKIINFIDLCSVSNISVFILDETYHGYYIHGQSPHGSCDVNIKDILVNFYREENQLSGSRGLRDYPDDQTFIVKITRSFRQQYEALFQKYNNYVGPKKTREDYERYTNVLLQSYKALNHFLCSFIDHSSATQGFHVRDRYFLEKMLDYEFRIRTSSDLLGRPENYLFIDKDRTFTQVLFFGEEFSIFVWNLSTFLFIDILASNYILAAVLTYMINKIFNALRSSFGRKNLSKKTLIPKNFLI